MNTQGYQLPPTPELTLFDMAPFIAMSLPSPGPDSPAAPLPVLPASHSIPNEQVQGNAVYASQQDRLKSILSDVQSIFDDDEDLFW